MTNEDVRTITETVDADQLFAECGIKDEVDELRQSDSKARYFSYRVNDYIIEVESTAASVMGVVAGLSMNAQQRLFLHLMQQLPEPGDNLTLLSNRDHKRRGARVVRVKARTGTVRLLVTH